MPKCASTGYAGSVSRPAMTRARELDDAPLAGERHRATTMLARRATVRSACRRGSASAMATDAAVKTIMMVVDGGPTVCGTPAKWPPDAADGIGGRKIMQPGRNSSALTAIDHAGVHRHSRNWRSSPPQLAEIVRRFLAKVFAGPASRTSWPNRVPRKPSSILYRMALRFAAVLASFIAGDMPCRLREEKHRRQRHRRSSYR